MRMQFVKPLIPAANGLENVSSQGARAAVRLPGLCMMSLHLTRLSLGERLKSLKRLFPSDQSMVVIIDDRADIWNWSPHLVKVIPCTTPFSRSVVYDLLAS